MKQFENAHCPICNKKFSQDDDIVVCPVCGTPHHRSCYLKEQQCANFDKHETRWFYQTENKHGHEDVGQTCSRCGNENAPDSLFCNLCGTPLQHNDMTTPSQTTMPWLKQVMSPLGDLSAKEKLGEFQVADFAAFIGSNTLYFLPRFKQFQNKKAISINFPALLAPSIYFLYRKMYLPGIFMLIMDLFGITCNTLLYNNSALPDAMLQVIYIASVIISLIRMTVSILSGLFANRLYYDKAVRTIRRCKKRFTEESQYQSALTKAGSVSMLSVSVGLALLFAGCLGIMYFITMLL